jgi:hypothetical protein
MKPALRRQSSALKSVLPNAVMTLI